MYPCNLVYPYYSPGYCPPILVQQQPMPSPSYLQHYQYIQLHVNPTYNIPLAPPMPPHLTQNINFSPQSTANLAFGPPPRDHRNLDRHNYEEQNQYDSSNSIEQIQEMLKSLTPAQVAAMSTENYIKYLDRGCYIGESIAKRNEQRPYFKNIQNLCRRTRNQVIKPNITVSNIHSQGEPWATKDFIFAFVRAINCWCILRGYLGGKGSNLGEIDREISPEFLACYSKWEESTKQLTHFLIQTFCKLDEANSSSNLNLSNSQVHYNPGPSTSTTNISTSRPKSTSPFREMPRKITQILTATATPSIDKKVSNTLKGIPGSLHLPSTTSAAIGDACNLTSESTEILPKDEDSENANRVYMKPCSYIVPTKHQASQSNTNIERNEGSSISSIINDNDVTLTLKGIPGSLHISSTTSAEIGDTGNPTSESTEISPKDEDSENVNRVYMKPYRYYVPTKHQASQSNTNSPQYIEFLDTARNVDIYLRKMSAERSDSYTSDLHDKVWKTSQRFTPDFIKQNEGSSISSIINDNDVTLALKGIPGSLHIPSTTSAEIGDTGNPTSESTEISPKDEDSENVNRVYMKPCRYYVPTKHQASQSNTNSPQYIEFLDTARNVDIYLRKMSAERSDSYTSDLHDKVWKTSQRFTSDFIKQNEGSSISSIINDNDVTLALKGIPGSLHIPSTTSAEIGDTGNPTSESTEISPKDKDSENVNRVYMKPCRYYVPIKHQASQSNTNSPQYIEFLDTARNVDIYLRKMSAERSDSYTSDLHDKIWKTSQSVTPDIIKQNEGSSISSIINDNDVTLQQNKQIECWLNNDRNIFDSTFQKEDEGLPRPGDKLLLAITGKQKMGSELGVISKTSKSQQVSKSSYRRSLSDIWENETGGLTTTSLNDLE